MSKEDEKEEEKVEDKEEETEDLRRGILDSECHPRSTYLQR